MRRGDDRRLAEVGIGGKIAFGAVHVEGRRSGRAAAGAVVFCMPGDGAAFCGGGVNHTSILAFYGATVGAIQDPDRREATGKW